MYQRKVAYVFLYRNGIKERSVGVLLRTHTGNMPEVTLELYETRQQEQKWRIFYFNRQDGVTEAAFCKEWTAEHTKCEMRRERYHLCGEAGVGRGVFLLPEEAFKNEAERNALPDVTEYLCARYDEEEVLPAFLISAWKRRTALPVGENACVQSAKKLMEEIAKASEGMPEGCEEELPEPVRKQSGQKESSCLEELLSKKASYLPWKGQEMLHSVKILPEDFSEMPEERKMWGENSFLLHGYYRYYHLLLGRRKKHEKEEYVLLVPGRYEKKEERLAASFGFPEFLPVTSETVKTASGLGRFGYWCGKI